MKVHAAALKHGISLDDAAQAAAWPVWIDYLDDNRQHGS